MLSVGVGGGFLGRGYSNSIGKDEHPSSIDSLSLGGPVKKLLSLGFSDTCVLLESGEVKCWGPSQRTPQTFALREGIVQLASSSSGFTCALLESNDLQCWGGNSNGELGLGHTTSLDLKRVVKENLGFPFGQGGRVLSASFDFSESSSDIYEIKFDGRSSFAKKGIQNYFWNFGDGTEATGDQVTHRFASEGVYNVSLEITDSLGQKESLERRLRISSPNLSPYLMGGQNFIIAPSHKKNIHLNSAVDFETTGLIYHLVDSPTKGALSGCLGGTGDLTCLYDASTDSGIDSFSYKASDGSSDSLTVSVKVHVLDSKRGEHSSVVKISSGGGHSCALYENKKIKCWGYNQFGQLGLGNSHTIGDNSGEEVYLQNFVSLGMNVLKVETGGEHTCALLEEGDVKCWGNNQSGQLGLRLKGYSFGTDEHPSSLKNVGLGGKVKELSLGNQFSCGLLFSGEVKCWGNNQFGQLGLGHTRQVGDNTSDVFESVNLGGGALKIAVGGNHACALLSEGKVRCWGYNNSGQLGLGHTHNIGDNESPHSAEFIQVGAKVLNLSLGDRHTCALLEDRSVKCWGDNHFSQLGRGHTRITIGDDEHPSSIGSINLGARVEKLSVGSDFTCALLENNQIKCWGTNFSGESGFTGGLGRINTVFFAKKDEVLDIELGFRQAFALFKDGSTVGWGLNNRGQLAIGHARNVGKGSHVDFAKMSSLGGEGKAVIARFVSEKKSRLRYSFDGSSSYSSGEALNYSWNFGDESTDTGVQVDHIFANMGIFNPTLTIRDSLGQVDSFSQRLDLSSDISDASGDVSGDVSEDSLNFFQSF